MTTHFLMTALTEHCRHYACQSGWIHVDLPGNRWTREPCDWCGGTGRQSMRIENVRENAS